MKIHISLKIVPTLNNFRTELQIDYKLFSPAFARDCPQSSVEIVQTMQYISHVHWIIMLYHVEELIMTLES